MCLDLKGNDKLQTAVEDIICYKYVKPITSISPSLFDNLDGSEFSGIIYGTACKGKISIDTIGRIFFCTNNSKLDGLDTSNKHEYKYSYTLDKFVEQIEVNGKVYECDTHMYSTPFQDALVEIGKTYKSNLTKRRSEVNEGLHSFKLLSELKNYLGTRRTCVIVKCIIPKGSNYYVGKFYDCESYASDTLEYNELIIQE